MYVASIPGALLSSVSVQAHPNETAEAQRREKKKKKDQKMKIGVAELRTPSAFCPGCFREISVHYSAECRCIGV